MSRQWTQLFVMIAEIRGCAIPVAFGYLPDKKELSYFLFNYMLLKAFYDHAEDFRAITGRVYLKLRTLTCDFEYAIHKG